MLASIQFNWSRFRNLLSYGLLLNYKLGIYSVVSFLGISMLFMFFIQLTNEYRSLDLESFLILFSVMYVGFGVLFSGTSFSNLRIKEKTISYLMLPASVFEKFLYEFLTKVMLFLVAMPILYFLSYYVEGYLFDALSRSFVFTPIDLDELAKVYLTPGASSGVAAQVFIHLVAIGILIIPFTGSVTFTKYPIVKTLFSCVTVVFFFVIYTYLIVEELGLNKFRIKESLLIPTSEVSAFRFFLVGAVIFNLTLIIVAFLKLKEREV